MKTYNAEEIYKHGDKCMLDGVVYRATCSGNAIQYIAPDENSIGTFWIVDEDEETQGVVHGLNP
tara:strand:- start:130 stop:321 length:192 start_codon:yes stop_codon:yes gene_type:complete